MPLLAVGFFFFVPTAIILLLAADRFLRPKRNGHASAYLSYLIKIFSLQGSS